VNPFTTNRVKHILESSTKIELAKQLGITRMTLDVRLRKHTWKKGEKEIIKRLFESKL
jgi:predicted DNA binding protein